MKDRRMGKVWRQIESRVDLAGLQPRSCSAEMTRVNEGFEERIVAGELMLLCGQS